MEEIKNGQSVWAIKDFDYVTKATEMDAYYFKRLLEPNPTRDLRNDDPKVYDNHPTLLNFVKKNEEPTTINHIETQGILKIRLSRFIDNSAKNSKSTYSQKNRNERCPNHIGENLHRPLTINHLADFCRPSTDYVSRLFKDTFGTRPSK